MESLWIPWPKEHTDVLIPSAAQHRGTLADLLMTVAIGEIYTLYSLLNIAS